MPTTKENLQTAFAGESTSRFHVAGFLSGRMARAARFSSSGLIVPRARPRK